MNPASATETLRPMPAPELPQLVRAVFRLSRRFKLALDGPLEGRLELGMQELLCLAAIDGGWNTPSTLSAYQGLPAPTTSRLIARLEGGGLVQRASDPGDLRRCLLRLTPKGQRARGHLRAEMEDIVQAQYAGLDAQLVHRALAALLELETALGGECKQLSSSASQPCPSPELP